jgi:serine/threonine protein kinase
VDATLDRFVSELTHSGLMSATEIADFQQTLPVDRQPTDGPSLARRLIEAHKLTEYQASAIIDGKTANLMFGEYRILDKIGEGGMGVVLKAEHQLMGRVVAVKVLSGAALQSPNIVRRFYREVKAAARLNHPNIVAAYDAGKYQDTHYLVMEYVDGQSLGQRVREQGPLPLSEALGYVIQAARGLQYAHEQGVVHRDVKPANLLVDCAGNVRILDMGLARLIDAGETPQVESLTRTGLVMGTGDYMAPEQAIDSHHVDHRVDIYALGCTLFRLLTGTVPYPADDLVAVLLAHRESRIPSLRSIRPELPSRIDRVFRRMVAKRPQDRYASMNEVIAALQEVLQPPVPVGRLRRWLSGWRWWPRGRRGPTTPNCGADDAPTISFHSQRGSSPPR